MKGLQKTLVSTIAGAVTRVRKSECQPAKYDFLLGLSKCSQYQQETISGLMSNFSQYLTFTDSDKDKKRVDLKTSRICCLTREMPANLQAVLGKVCPQETPTVVRIYNLLLEDVLNMICARSDMTHCNAHFADFKPSPSQRLPDLNIIASIVSIIFSLGE